MLKGNFEERAASGVVKLEENKLVGQWMLFNEESSTLVAERDGQPVLFREVILPEATDRAIMDRIVCCADHDDKAGYLGRMPGSLSIERNDRGFSYDCDLLEEMKIVPELRAMIKRGDYQGNSYRFYVRKDAWERQADGSYIRYVSDMAGVEHIGPVKNPAYVNTHVDVAMRSLMDSGLLAEMEAARREAQGPEVRSDDVIAGNRGFEKEFMDRQLALKLRASRLRSM